MTEETFGPTLVINTVRHMDEAVDLANNTYMVLAPRSGLRKMVRKLHHY